MISTGIDLSLYSNKPFTVSHKDCVDILDYPDVELLQDW